MQRKKQQQKDADSSVLFPVKVEGFEIKPWSFGQSIDLMPIFERLTERFTAEGINFKDFQSGKDIAKLVKLVLPEAPAVLSITLRISEDEVRQWDLNKASVIVLTVINLNLEHLKNLPGLVSQAVKMMQN